MTARQSATSSALEVERPSRRLTGREPVCRRHSNHRTNDIRSGNGTAPSLMHSSRVTPSGCPDTSLLMVRGEPPQPHAAPTERPHA